MDIGAIFYEVDSINKEIKRLRAEIKNLDKRKNQLLDDLIKNMQENDQTEFIYNGKCYKLEAKQLRNRKKVSEKRQDIMQVIYNHGFENEEAEKVYTEFVDSLRGETKTIYRLT